MAIDKAYRPLMLMAMVLELVLLSLIVWQEFRRTAPPVDPPARLAAPQARYVQFGMGPLILDTQTGAVCDSYPSGSQAPGGYPPCANAEEKEIR